MQGSNFGKSNTKAFSHLRSRPRIMLVALAAFVAGHGIFFHFVPQISAWRAGVSGVLILSVVLLVMATHLGFFAGMTRSLRHLFRR